MASSTTEQSLSAQPVAWVISKKETSERLPLDSPKTGESLKRAVDRLLNLPYVQVLAHKLQFILHLNTPSHEEKIAAAREALERKREQASVEQKSQPQQAASNFSLVTEWRSFELDLEKKVIGDIQYLWESFAAQLHLQETVGDILQLLTEGLLGRVRAIENMIVSQTRKTMRIVWDKGIVPTFILSEKAILESNVITHVASNLERHWALRISKSVSRRLSSPQMYWVWQVQPLWEESENDLFLQILMEAETGFDCPTEYQNALKEAFKTILNSLFVKLLQMEKGKMLDFVDPVTGLGNELAHDGILKELHEKQISYQSIELIPQPSKLVKFLGTEALSKKLVPQLNSLQREKRRACYFDGKLVYIASGEDANEEIRTLVNVLKKFHEYLQKIGDSSYFVTHTAKTQGEKRTVEM